MDYSFTDKYNIIDVLRCRFFDTFTQGIMCVNGKFQCYTLEPFVYPEVLSLRDFKAQKEVEKSYRKRYLACPSGIYDLTLKVASPLYVSKSWSRLFNGGFMPRVLTSSHDGLLIHPGNYDTDTKGCVLVGSTFNDHGVYNSIQTFKILYTKLKSFKQPIKIRFTDVR